MALSNLSATVQATLSGTATVAATGTTGGTWSPSLATQDSFSFGTNTTGTADILHFQQATIALSSSLSINTQALAGALGTFNSARSKDLIISHLSNSVASSIKWDLSVTNSFLGWFGGAGATTTTITLLPGESIKIGGPTALGQTINSTTNIIKLTNNDGANAATVQFGFVGADA